ncbi:helix-turn-helix domain-containing protein [Pseudomonas lactis]|uniref:helix-turn-helix domain-containing protein n=1 Tax=Pseudomonas lactis TaxID=1615674 RepID=UPI001040BFC6|nr:helix-turn-helix domain-containing protein [Pseudomonas lactis]MBK3445372.1 helix-turn-helix domain-containing protein [Pseudomonas lactis]
MSLRSAYGSTLKFLRTRHESSQDALGKAADRSYISRLEAGEHSVTVDVSHSIACALGIDPLSLLVLAYAAERRQTPQQVLDHLAGDLASAGLLTTEIPSRPSDVLHPVPAAAEELSSQIRELIEQGLSQSAVARQLGVSRQTVSRHLKKSAEGRS